MGSTNYFGTLFTILAALISIVKADECGQEELAQCQRSLSELNEYSDLTFLSRKADLQKQCPDLHAGLECIKSYTRRCMSQDQRDHFNKLYAGTAEMIHQLCEDTRYQEDYLRHAPCLHQVKDEYEDCLGKYHNVMAKITSPDQQKKRDEFGNVRNTTVDAVEGIKELCCVFREFIACSEYTVKKSCGKEAAFFTRTLLDKISSSLMRIHCSGFKSDPGTCGQPYYSSSMRHLSSYSFLIIAILPFALRSILNYSNRI